MAHPGIDPPPKVVEWLTRIATLRATGWKCLPPTVLPASHKVTQADVEEYWRCIQKNAAAHKRILTPPR